MKDQLFKIILKCSSILDEMTVVCYVIRREVTDGINSAKLCDVLSIYSGNEKYLESTYVCSVITGDKIRVLLLRFYSLFAYFNSVF